MNNIIAIGILIIIVFSSCQYEEKMTSRYINPHLTIETITINTTRDTLIVSRGGVLLKIPKKLFNFQNGLDVNGNVDLIIQEALSIKDIALGNLTTESNGNIIESGGMLNIIARKDSNNLKIASGKKIEVSFPNYTGKESWQLFQGEFNIVRNKYNWNILPNPINVSQIDTVAVDSDFEIITSDTSTTRTWTTTHFIFEICNNDTSILDSCKSFSSSYFGKWRTIVSDEQETNTITPADTVFILPRKEYNYFNFSITELGWINIDKFLDEQSTAEIKLIALVNNSDLFESSKVSAIFLDRQVYLDGFMYKKGWFLFSSKNTTKINVPLDDRVLLVLESYNKEGLFYDLQELTLKPENIIKLNPQKITREKLDSLLLQSI